MNNDTTISLCDKPFPDEVTDLLKDGARRMIKQAVETELAEFLDRHGDTDSEGRRNVVRNGHQPEREILTGLGPVPVKVPKTRDRAKRGRCFRSLLLPPYSKKTRRLEAVLPWPYLKRISTNDFDEALQALFGESVRGPSEVYPETRAQRCWVHKTANVFDKLPRSVQPQAKSALHGIRRADTRKRAKGAFDRFLSIYEDKYPKAAECLRKDRDDLLSFYDFPAPHRQHLRTTNPSESTFATIRLRTDATRNCVSARSGLALMYQLAMSAQQNWRRLRGFRRLPDVVAGVNFIDGVEERTTTRTAA